MQEQHLIKTDTAHDATGGRAFGSASEKHTITGVATFPTPLVNRWPASRIDDLMPWAYAKIPA
jgi:hypothetical protein